MKSMNKKEIELPLYFSSTGSYQVMAIVLNPDRFIVLVGAAFSVEAIQAYHESH